MAKSRPSAAAVADKTVKNAQAAGPYYQQGVQNATGWLEGALAAANRRNAGLMAAINNGTIDAGMQRAGDAGWKAATLGKGVKNWSAAMSDPATKQRIQQGAQTNMNMIAQVDSATANMPRDTLEQRLAYAAERSRAMASLAAARKQAG